MRLFFQLLLLTFLLFSSICNAQSVRSVLDKMYQGIGSANSITYDMTSSERIGTKMVYKNREFKLQISPRKVYMKDKDSGVELLYVAGWNNNQPFINPNGFPYVNVSFDINSPRVRADGHHPVTHAGFSYLYSQVKNMEKKIVLNGKKLEDVIKVAGDFTWNGRSCTKLVIENHDFQFISYTCIQSESLFNLCERINVSEYMVMEKNNLDYGAILSKGMIIRIPNAFAKKVELYIDKANGLPIYQVVYDDKGLFEKFECKNLKVNPTVDSKEWTSQCASYGFK